MRVESVAGTRVWWACCLSAMVGLGALVVPHAHAADAESSADELRVHCLFPGKVRRLGAFSSVVTPRRAAQVSAAECQAGGGEYVVRQDPHLAVRQVWLPLAAEGVAEAQLTVGELYEQQGQTALARVWYEKARSTDAYIYSYVRFARMTHAKKKLPEVLSPCQKYSCMH